MAKHKTFTVATNVKVYFCDSRSPWQRGSNENTNGPLRQYFPKRTDLSAIRVWAVTGKVKTARIFNDVRLRVHWRALFPLTFYT
jgi:hypothetical protein